jgi:hypothetical protein
MKLKRFLAKYSPIIIGALYGLGMRLLFNIPQNHYGFSFTDLFSITFIWIVPLVIGITPMIFARRENLESVAYRSFSPLLSVLTFFIICFITRIEDLVCIIVIGFPFLLCAVMGGLFFGAFILNYRQRKGILYSVLFIPLLAGMIEEQFKTPSQQFDIKTVTLIHCRPDSIWKNIVRVKQISDEEYNKGLFNYAGIPQPLYAELDRDAIGATGIGHFDGGLQFKETVNQWQRNKKVSFNIRVIPSTLRKTVFDRHLLTGKHFEFLNASYELKPINNSQTQLTLTSSYKLDTRINAYASFWGNNMLGDFQERLLEVIKKRCESRK